jgi:ferric-dicitrate binding protein FerR (iron transport regulator)
MRSIAWFPGSGSNQPAREVTEKPKLLPPPLNSTRRCRLNDFGIVLILSAGLLPGLARAQRPAPEASRLLETSGQVEVATVTNSAWRAAHPNDVLQVGDRLRTGKDSRATLRLSDKSVIRVDQNTVLELTPPLQPASRKRFLLRWGSLFFLNREKPADVEFETPLATGAIRGTEFLLTATEEGGESTLALFDGAVELQIGANKISLTSGQQVELQRGRPPFVHAALAANSLIQWTFYYPGVLNTVDLKLTEPERSSLQASLQAYREGDLVGALGRLPANLPSPSPAADTFRAAVKLSVGRADEAGVLLSPLSPELPPVRALREMMAAVGAGEWPSNTNGIPLGNTSSEWLAHSYFLQSRSRLPEALAAARRAAEIAPDFGFAQARLAELEFGFEHRSAARTALARARELSPRNAQAFALEGFVALDERKPRTALDWFEQAKGLDGSLGSSWLGSGLAKLQLREFNEGRQDLQTGAALEPQRSLFRSYLGKAFSQTHDDALAKKDFRLAKELDPADPTPWLYSALHDQQINQVNESVRELERSVELNDNRSVFRSRLLLDRDLSIRSADLAAIYDEAGLIDFSRVTASRAVSEDYANFSGHLFLSRSLQSNEDPYDYNLRYETPRQSELLIGNLLAPVGGANLSQVLSQQDYLHYFDAGPVGLSSLTQYGSQGDWQQAATFFGTIDDFSYALDSEYLSLNGQEPNADLESLRFILTAKQQFTPVDSVYFQVGYLNRESGDIVQHYDPAATDPDVRVKEQQEPTFYAGYHHEWGPGSHTLLLVSYLRDHLTLHDLHPNVLSILQSGGAIVDIGSYPFAELNFESQFGLASVELQQIWENEFQSVIVGGRYQHGSAENSSVLVPLLPSANLADSIEPTMERIDGYAYYQVRPFTPLRITGGLAYDYLQFPVNADLPPLSGGEQSRSLVEPKAAAEFSPWSGGNLRAAFTRSLGGLYFDNSVRLEPAQLAGFTTAYRSMIPESVVGLVPGTQFQTAGVGFDQSLRSGTYFGIEGDILKSNGSRNVGAISNSTPIALPDSAALIRQDLDFRESSVSLYLNQLLGNCWSLGARYRVSEAELTSRYPDVPTSAPNAPLFNQDVSAVLGELQLSALFNHPSGFFARWQSDLYYQHNFDYTPALPGDSFWQQNVYIGYRLKHQHAEVRLGVLNLTGQDYRLNPLNLHLDLPRTRTFTASLRLNF